MNAGGRARDIDAGTSSVSSVTENGDNPLQSQEITVANPGLQRSSSVHDRSAGPAPDTLRSLPAVLTVDQTAAALGVNRKTVFAMCQPGTGFPHQRVGPPPARGTRDRRPIRIARSALLDWLSANDAGCRR